jgi:endonuclease YncB( thermonuclease family)
LHWSLPWTTPATQQNEQDRETEAIWRRAGATGARHQVDVLYTVDGDTFGARVHLWPGLDMTTRVRLRGIDAPELKGQCADELKRAEAATEALRALLAEGSVAIYDIGPDKYQGRVVANVTTKRTPSVSAALLSGGFARAYDGGHRNGWCGLR